MVKDAPRFPQVYESLSRFISHRIVVCHTSFDRVAMARAVERYGLPLIECVWLDSARVARRAWSQFASKGYGLKNVASTLGIEFKHHVAKEDARAAGEILIRAITETGIGLNDWLERIKTRIGPSKAISELVPNPDGPLAGEVLVFTGALIIPRIQAAELAAKAGCRVANSITKETTMLVVGDQDIRKLAGDEKSSKHRKAEELILKGQPICTVRFHRRRSFLSGGSNPRAR